MSLDLDARYSVKGYRGVAFFIHGFPKKNEPIIDWVECGEPGCACEEGGQNLHEVEVGSELVEQDETCGRVLVVMVGDDRKHEVDVEDLTPLAEDAYCGSCGQIGCGHG